MRPNPNGNSGGTGTNTGLVVGLSVGFVAIFLGVVGGAVFYMKKQRNSNLETKVIPRTQPRDNDTSGRTRMTDEEYINALRAVAIQQPPVSKIIADIRAPAESPPM